MKKDLFGRLPQYAGGRDIMTRDGHFGFIEEVKGSKVVTSCGTFPKKDIMIRRYMECGDVVEDERGWYIIKSRTLTDAVLISKDGECSKSLFDLKRAGCFYPGERVEHNKREYVVMGAAYGIFVLRNENGYDYADKRNLRALDVEERLEGKLTPDFTEPTQEDVTRISYTCELLAVLRNLRHLKWTNKDITNVMRIRL